MSDLVTMIWKEWKDVLFQGGGWKAWIRPLFMLGIVGVYVPLQEGRLWLSLQPLTIFVLLWVPLFVVINFMADAFAGERERHTLETLLASRMPDRAILLGKVFIVVAYGWLLMLVSVALGLVLVNLTHPEGAWQFYPSDLFVGLVLLSLAINAFGAGAGVLVSLRSTTVRQAQQIMSVGTLILSVGAGFALSTLLPNLLASYSLAQLLAIGVVIVAVIDAVLLAFAIARFQRARLILS